ncbi:MAG TPA: NADH-quinone oxidoreductase subunit C, partial [Burkholderiaceae bacterium]
MSRKQWRSAASVVRGLGGRLVALWGTDRQGMDPAGDRFSVSAAYATGDGLTWLELPVASDDRTYPGIADVFPAAARMQRATADLLGLTVEDASAGAVDRRPWLRHAAWPADYFPLRHENSGQERFPGAAERYPFVPVEGDGVHEIAVGPVHAGIIEPGHFRFSVVGEKVLRLEQRLGYKHKGIEKLFESMRVDDAAGPRLASRVSGDSTVAYAWAFSMAA